MYIPKEFTTVTRFSKALAMILFIILPFVGFWLGIKYQSIIDYSTKNQNLTPTTQANPSIIENTTLPFITPIDPNWKVVETAEYVYEYPKDWVTDGVYFYKDSPLRKAANHSCLLHGEFEGLIWNSSLERWNYDFGTRSISDSEFYNVNNKHWQSMKNGHYLVTLTDIDGKRAVKTYRHFDETSSGDCQYRNLDQQTFSIYNDQNPSQYIEIRFTYDNKDPSFQTLVSKILSTIQFK